jgi:hypothetical protein
MLWVSSRLFAERICSLCASDSSRPLHLGEHTHEVLLQVVLLVALVVVKGAAADLHQLLAVHPWIELSNM